MDGLFIFIINIIYNKNKNYDFINPDNIRVHGITKINKLIESRNQDNISFITSELNKNKALIADLHS